MSSTITREQLLSLMTAQGGEETGALVARLLTQAPWTDQQTFTKADMAGVLEAIAQNARETFMTPDPAVTPEEQNHVMSMLDAVQAHALPILREHAKD